jgi:hypothetical protein
MVRWAVFSLFAAHLFSVLLQIFPSVIQLLLVSLDVVFEPVDAGFLAFSEALALFLNLFRCEVPGRRKLK